MKCSIYTCDNLSKLTATKYDVSSEVTFTGSSGELKGTLEVNDKNYTISASNYSKLPIQLGDGIVKEDNKYTIDIDSTEKAKIIPENIKKDISVLGVTGTAEPEILEMSGINYCSYSYPSSYDIIFSKDKNYPIPASTESMFSNNSMLEHVDLSGLDLSQVASANEMFLGCSSLQSVSGLNFSANLTETANMFFYCGNLSSIDLSGFSASNSITNMYAMFMYCSSLTELDLESLDFSKATNLSYLFDNCTQLTVDLSKISIASATTLDYCFTSVKSFTNVTSIKYWDTSKITSMGYLFSDSGLSGAVVLEWDCSSLTDLVGAFAHCESLTSCSIAADISTNPRMDLSLEYLFSNCTALTFVNLNIILTTRYIYGMFSGCTALTTIRIPNLNISSASSTSVKGAFDGVKNCTIYVKNSTIQTLLQNNIDSTNTVVVAS